MSILGKSWQLKHERSKEESLWSALLAARKVQNPGTFFTNAQLSDLHDPFLFQDMQKAVDRLQKAIPARERIVVYGDYDVDGTSGAALLVHTLRFLGAEVSYRIPHRRKDGYGLHQKYVEELSEQKVAVLITVDCGISCPAEVAAAQEKGIDVILTDHHHIPAERPQAFATLHPQLAPDYPFPHLSGSGVAFKLASALLIASENEDMIPLITDLASLGTVADCVPLQGENRAIVKLGLKQMRNTKWEGLQAILETAGVWDKGEFTSETIGFQVGPRINASGRIDDPLWSMQTLLATGPEARQKSQKLEELNQRRRQMTKDILAEAEAVLDVSQPLLMAAGPWPSGVVGLIAGRLQEKYGKPAFIMEDKGETLTGSARSLPGFHAVEALNAAQEHLQNYGGHEQAAGFSLLAADYQPFQKAIQDFAKEHFAKNPLKIELPIDCLLNAEDLNLETTGKISQFAPFGVGNPSPYFLLEKTKLIQVATMGADHSHLRFTLDLQGQLFDGVAFRMAEHEEALWKAERCVVQLQERVWRGERSLQLHLVDFV